MVFLNFACGKVYVGQRVKLGDDDVDVVGTDAVADAHDGLAAVGAADSMEFARLNLECLCVKESGNHIYTSGVAAQDDAVGKLIGVQVDVESGSVAVDDKLAWGNDFLVCHRWYVFMCMCF